MVFVVVVRVEYDLQGGVETGGSWCLKRLHLLGFVEESGDFCIGGKSREDVEKFVGKKIAICFSWVFADEETDFLVIGQVETAAFLDLYFLRGILIAGDGGLLEFTVCYL